MNITYLLFQALFLSYVLFFSSLPVVTTADSTAAVIVENPKIDKLKLQSGFKAEHLFSPSEKEMTTWETKTFNNKNKILESDQ